MLILFMAATSSFAANVPVTIKATADNFFIVVLTQGQTHTKVYVDNNNTWQVPNDTVIQVPDTNLSSCNVDFITWNGTRVRGFAGSVSGNNGTLNSGNSAVQTFRTSVFGSYGGATAIYPSSAQIAQIFASKIIDQQVIYSSTLGVWGEASNIGFPSAVDWISPSTTRGRFFAIHRFPCSSFVKPAVVRPTPIPRPRPIPLPNVKGDHFSCYMLEKGPNLKPENITITDQFGSAKAVLGMPKMICNPSEKIHNRTKFEIKNKERHLVCYEILEQSPNKNYDLEISNQFERRKVRSTNRELFCVPSLKKHL